ncbi:MAG: CDP-6-deoxy-delta-3,4-glucoseen reductase [Burkholderiaceae bacterium]|nr:CDP-6-deoxy-delta-3,4-glucoseen reductase [Burkholderiaceae bacterium]
MSFTITVQPSGRSFVAEPGESLLAASIRQNIGLPYSCKEGACGACKCRKLAGEVTHGPYQERLLSAADVAAGFVLTCRAVAQSDVTLQARQVTRQEAFAVKKMPARVVLLEKLSHDVMLLKLQLPANDLLQYHAGQYVEFVLRDGSRRCYSMASAPHTLTEGGAAAAPMVELHIRHMPGGKFTDHVFGAMKEKDILRIEGPFGGFYLREDSQKPILLLASGTGFAPAKAMLEHLQHTRSTRAVALYWGARRPQDLYLDAWVKAKQAEMPATLRYVPVVSDALPQDHWTGRTGFVHLAALQDQPDLSGHEVYACGAPAMVQAAQRDFVAQAALPEDAFFADAFTSAASGA